jgi:hypothetical protein
MINGKTKKYHTVGIIPKSNIKIVERGGQHSNTFFCGLPEVVKEITCVLHFSEIS